MAEKEERIEISKYDLNNKEWNGDTPIDIQKVYTRQEVIERMAKAFNSVVTIISQEACLEGIEAALNSLIEKGE